MGKQGTGIFRGIPGRRRGACLPGVMFWLLAGSVALLGGLEVANTLRHPSVLRVESPDGGSRLTFYQTGGAADRTAWLFHEAGGTGGAPALIQRIDCTPADRTTGEIRWTADGGAVYAVSRAPHVPGADPDLLWLYELTEQRLFITREESAVRGPTVILAEAGSVVDRWRRRGGAGGLVAQWYDLGKRGSHLFFWQTTRWKRQLPE